MELENSQNNALAKLPMLKLGEYKMWEIRIKQYFQIHDYALWEVIEIGNSWVPIPVIAPESGPSTALKMTMPSTTEENICKKNDVKARSLLLMALLNEHQLTFNQYVDAQSMFAAIKARFRGNEATKRTQKALLKQQYENFNASSSESLDSIFNRLQKLVSRLAILGVVTPLEDLNVKFLRSLPSEWDTHVHKEEKFYQRNWKEDSSLMEAVMDMINQGRNVSTVIKWTILTGRECRAPQKTVMMILLVKLDATGFKALHTNENSTPEVNAYGLRDSNVRPSLVVIKDKDWKEKFFCPANQVREEEPKKARENNDAPIIEDWVSDDERRVEPIPKGEKKN
ncbi:hypothetical protein Tco_0531501 [Tanacetum coccineum]